MLILNSNLKLSSYYSSKKINEVHIKKVLIFSDRV